MGRMARGVKGITLRGEDDYVVGCEIVKGTESILTVCENGFGKRSAVEEFRQTNRGGVGVRSIIVNERNGKVVRALCVTDEDGLTDDVCFGTSGPHQHERPPRHGTQHSRGEAREPP